MKNLQLVLFAAVLLTSCTTEKPVSVHISGHIPTDVADYMIIWNAAGKDTIQFTQGDFDYTLTLNQAGFYRMMIGNSRHEVFLAPGSDLRIDADSLSNPLNIHFSGSLGPENSYLAASFQTLNQMDYKEMFTLEPEQFLKQLDSLYKETAALLASSKTENNLNEDFLKLIVVKETAGKGDKLLKYPDYHAYFSHAENPVLPAGYYDFISQTDINNPDYSGLYEVKNFTESLISYYSSLLLMDSVVDPTLADAQIRSELMAINQHLTDSALKNNFLFNSLSNYLEYYGPADLAWSMDFFIKNCTDTGHIREIKEAMESWSYLLPGKEAPVWEAVTIDGKPVKSTDFLGKYLYVDIWATWCGPCRREIPYMKELITSFKGKNVNFVSVSVDKEKADWEKMVSEDPFGNQLFVEGAFQSTLATQFKVNAIPRFLLIDPQGKIINVSADRPSGKIADILHALPGI